MQDSLNQIYTLESSVCSLYGKFGGYSDIFTQILTIRSNGFALLREYASKKELTIDGCEVYEKTEFSSLDDIFLYAINYEKRLCESYEKLTDVIEDEELRDICFRLWATSENEYLPALKMCLKEIYKNETISQIDTQKSEKNGQNFASAEGLNNMLSNYQKEFANIGEKLQNIMSGKASEQDIKQILNSPNFSFFSGLALGALGASLLAKNLEKDKTDE